MLLPGPRRAGRPPVRSSTTRSFSAATRPLRATRLGSRRIDGPTRRRADHRFVHAHRTSDPDQDFEDGNFDAVLEAD